MRSATYPLTTGCLSGAEVVIETAGPPVFLSRRRARGTRTVLCEWPRLGQNDRFEEQMRDGAPCTAY
jgi:hypothetical protein